jgi:hypothetical protein
MSPQEIAGLVDKDANDLKRSIIEPSEGDLRCLIYGHLARLAVWSLRKEWDKDLPINEKLSIVRTRIEETGSLKTIVQYLKIDDYIFDNKSPNEVTYYEIPF